MENNETKTIKYSDIHELSSQNKKDNSNKEQSKVSMIAENVFSKDERNLSYIDDKTLKSILQQLGVSEQLLNDEYAYRRIQMMVAGSAGENVNVSTKKGMEEFIGKLDENLTITENSISGPGLEMGEYAELSLDEDKNLHDIHMFQHENDEGNLEIHTSESIYDGKSNEERAALYSKNRYFDVEKPKDSDLLTVDELATLKDIPDEYATQIDRLQKTEENRYMPTDKEPEEFLKEESEKNEPGIINGENNLKERLEGNSIVGTIISNLMNAYDIRDFTTDTLTQARSFLENTLQRGKETQTIEKESEEQEIE